MLVQEIMQTDLVTVPADGALRSAVERMLANRTGSVIVVRDGTPAGIITERDVLLAGYRAERPFADVPVEAAMSEPLVTIAETATLRKAAERMQEEEIKKLPVLDDLELVGIVTLTDLVYNQHDLVKEAHRLERQR